MKFPSGERYNEAVQNAHVYFLDPEIRSRRLQTDALGLPEVLSGGFAFTYRFKGGSGDVAVRCFHREIPELFERYKAISAFLGAFKSNFFVDFTFSERGVRVEGEVLPVVRMQWVEGETLLGYVNRNRSQPTLLANLRRQLLAFSEEAESRGYAHGDVQHRNLMVNARGELKLVDYDGLYVPALSRLKATDAGQPNFQAPSRTAADFGVSMDRFPLAVIDFSLEVLQELPELFDRFHRGENLILSHSDYINPAASPCLNAIANSTKLTSRVAAFSDLCGLSTNEMPRLSDFRKGLLSAHRTTPTRSSAAGFSNPQVYNSPFAVVDGMHYQSAVTHVGRQVELIGRVMKVKRLPGQRLVSLRFGNQYANTPAVVMPFPVYEGWAGATKIAMQPWVSAVGVLQRHRSGKYSTVQILIKSLSDIEVLGGKDEVDFRLGRKTRVAPISPPVPPNRTPGAMSPPGKPSNEWVITRAPPAGELSWFDPLTHASSVATVSSNPGPAVGQRITSLSQATQSSAAAPAQPGQRSSGTEQKHGTPPVVAPVNVSTRWAGQAVQKMPLSPTSVTSPNNPLVIFSWLARQLFNRK